MYGETERILSVILLIIIVLGCGFGIVIIQIKTDIKKLKKENKMLKFKNFK